MPEIYQGSHHQYTKNIGRREQSLKLQEIQSERKEPTYLFIDFGGVITSDTIIKTLAEILYRTTTFSSDDRDRIALATQKSPDQSYEDFIENALIELFEILDPKDSITSKPYANAFDQINKTTFGQVIPKLIETFNLRIVGITANPQIIAEGIKENLGLFDVISSTPEEKLITGKHKFDALEEYREENDIDPNKIFVVGDSEAEIPLLSKYGGLLSLPKDGRPTATLESLIELSESTEKDIYVITNETTQSRNEILENTILKAVGNLIKQERSIKNLQIDDIVLTTLKEFLIPHFFIDIDNTITDTTIIAKLAKILSDNRNILTKPFLLGNLENSLHQYKENKTEVNRINVVNEFYNLYNQDEIVRAVLPGIMLMLIPFIHTTNVSPINVNSWFTTLLSFITNKVKTSIKIELVTGEPPMIVDVALLKWKNELPENIHIYNSQFSTHYLEGKDTILTPEKIEAVIDQIGLTHPELIFGAGDSADDFLLLEHISKRGGLSFLIIKNENDIPDFAEKNPENIVILTRDGRILNRNSEDSNSLLEEFFKYVI